MTEILRCTGTVIKAFADMKIFFSIVGITVLSGIVWKHLPISISCYCIDSSQLYLGTVPALFSLQLLVISQVQPGTFPSFYIMEEKSCMLNTHF